MKAYRPFILASLLAMGPEVMACSSCGSGGGDPLILFPNEQQKVYLSQGEQTGFHNVRGDGLVVKNYGLERRRQLYASFGLRVTPFAFVTLGVPYIENIRGSQKVSGVGDPQINGRYTFVRQSIAAPMVPQVQMVVGLKQGRTAGSHESEDPLFMDVMGTGFDDVRMGADLWWAMTKVVFGFSYSETYSIKEDYRGTEHQAGTLAASNVTLGYADQGFKLISGLVRSQRAVRRLDGEAIDDSEMIKHNVFVTYEQKAFDRDAIRLTWVREGILLRNKNTNQATSLTLSWMRAW